MSVTKGARRSSRAQKQAVAAGGVVMRGSGPDREVVLAGRASDGTWVFPKGTPNEGETLEQTAVREVREETGLEVRLLRPLGTVDYSFSARGERIRKRVHFHLMEAVGGDTSQHDNEYDDVRWVRVADARRMLSFDTYREVLDRALADAAA